MKEKPEVIDGKLAIEIDFQKLKKEAKKYAKNSTLDEAQFIISAVDALEQWERCGGRQWSGFRSLLDSVNLALEDWR